MMPVMTSAGLMSTSSAGTSSPQQIPALYPLNIEKKKDVTAEHDPEATVIALSPRSIMGNSKFTCDVCNKEFPREVNLKMHYRSHKRVWELKKSTGKKVYICPVVNCKHHHPASALCDRQSIKRHYSRKHGEKKWKCPTCPKSYAVEKDLKAHAKICDSARGSSRSVSGNVSAASSCSVNNIFSGLHLPAATEPETMDTSSSHVFSLEEKYLTATSSDLDIGFPPLPASLERTSPPVGKENVDWNLDNLGNLDWNLENLDEFGLPVLQHHI